LKLIRAVCPAYLVVDMITAVMFGEECRL